MVQRDPEETSVGTEPEESVVGSGIHSLPFVVCVRRVELKVPRVLESECDGFSEVQGKIRRIIITQPS